jgi:V8-like Glu-specific endopeptidase
MRQQSQSQTGSRAAAALVAWVAVGFSSFATTSTIAAVFGSDDRVEVPARLDVVGRSVGMLFNNEARTVCTAFCVSDNTIATAAHCLFKTAGETPPRVADFWFGRLNGSNSREFARIAGFTTASTPQHVMAAKHPPAHRRHPRLGAGSTIPAIMPWSGPAHQSPRA